MTPHLLRVPAVLALLVLPALGQTDQERLDRLERDNAELRRRIDLLAEEQELFQLESIVPPMEDSLYGLGPAASKVYAKDQGLSIGGYGEMLYRNFAGGTDELDFLRAVFYFGYKFSERWIFNSEIEFEHASTAANGSASVEFAYIDYLYEDEVNFRAGILLVPMGFVNELHEPPTFLGASRPETERRIMPTTWRENGIGVFGDIGPITYRSYVVNGFDADGSDGDNGFSDGGLRGGRQRGSEALADDFAFVLRADWTDTPGLLAGASVYFGDAGQGQAGLGDTGVSIYEVHAEWKAEGLWLRGLAAMAEVDDVAALNASSGFVGMESVGEELEGWYLEGGYDVLSLLAPDCTASLSPYVRYESVDTQAAVPAGFAADPDNDFDVLTVGLNFQPIPGLAFKLDYADYDGGGRDRLQASVGYAF